MREEGLPLPLAFQYLIPGMHQGSKIRGGRCPPACSMPGFMWYEDGRSCDLNLVMISSLALKWQVLKFGMPIFQPLYEVKLKTSMFKVLPF